MSPVFSAGTYCLQQCVGTMCSPVGPFFKFQKVKFIVRCLPCMWSFCSLCLPLSFSFFYKPPSGEQPNLRDVNINTIEQNSRNKQPTTNASETKQQRFPFFALLLLPANGRTHCSAIHSRLPSRTPHRRSATTRCPPTLNRGGLNW